tara:strand:+ start:1191 stop:1508 length:318 start_codon:yes stop_codon:yes gene_type:complete
MTTISPNNTQAQIVISPRSQALSTFLADQCGAFPRWGDVLRCCRDGRRNEVKRVLRDTPREGRVQAFQRIAGRLSGAESVYAIWVFNLFGDDPTRETGQALVGIV